MNATRLKAIEDGQTGIARKVLDAVPIGEAWTPGKILGEVRRHGSNMDLRIFEGCLTSLVDAGVIRQSGGCYRRVFARPNVAEAEAVADAHDQVPPPPLAAESPELLEQWGRIGAHLRSFSASFATLADEIDALAIETADKLAKAGAGDERLRALRALLKDVVA